MLFCLNIDIDTFIADFTSPSSRTMAFEFEKIWLVERANVVDKVDRFCSAITAILTCGCSIINTRVCKIHENSHLKMSLRRHF